MKRSLILIIFILSFKCHAQTSLQEPDSLLRKFKLDFALPDVPAFKSLENEPSKILRPSTPEAFSALVSEFFTGNELILPKSLGIEVSPLLIAGSNKLTLNSFKKHPVLYSTRISFGSYRNSDRISTSSVGIRLTIIDKGDAKNDNKFLGNLTSLLSNSLKSEIKIRNEYLKEMKYTFEQWATDTVIKAEVDSVVSTRYTKPGDLDKKIERLKEDYKKENWNSQKLDFAFALTGYSKDSLVKSLKYKSTAFWLTWALPVKKFGQLLLGSHVFTYKDSADNKFYTDFYLNSRLYVGSNRLKGFAELQYAMQQKDNIKKVLFDLGAEINISNGIWLDFYSGVDKKLPNENPVLSTSFRLRFTLPESFKY
ncbi:MAG TPA: hypothetical protein VMT63_10635 [Bacteroidales bacterium]|nr:hypothetical protein [Bacteroidales bacterium]